MKAAVFSVIVFIMFSSLSGCVTAGSINQHYQKIVFEDGVNKKEALIIAQKYCLDDEFCNENFDISSARPYEDPSRYPGKWAVFFSEKSWSVSTSPCVIALDKTTGKVENFDILY